MSRDFMGTARLKLSPLCTLPYIALARIYEKIVMRIDVTADRLYAKPRLGMIPTSWGFLLRTLDAAKMRANSYSIHGITAPA